MFQFKLRIRMPHYQMKASLDASLGWRGRLFSGSMENVEVKTRQGARSGLGGHESDISYVPQNWNSSRSRNVVPSQVKTLK